jgi:hypothetical protein
MKYFDDCSDLLLHCFDHTQRRDAYEDADHHIRCGACSVAALRFNVLPAARTSREPSFDASFMTGSVVAVDGGYTVQ